MHVFDILLEHANCLRDAIDVTIRGTIAHVDLYHKLASFLQTHEEKEKLNRDERLTRKACV